MSGMEERISKENVEHIAELTRLHLSGEEVNKFTDQLSDVLEYVDQLPENRSTNHQSPITNHNTLREDKVQSSEVGTQELLENVPQTDGSSIKVPAVLGGDDE